MDMIHIHTTTQQSANVPAAQSSQKQEAMIRTMAWCHLRRAWNGIRIALMARSWAHRPAIPNCLHVPGRITFGMLFGMLRFFDKTCTKIFTVA